MSRHSRIVMDLDGLVDFGAVSGWVRDIDPRDSTRIEWILQLNPATRRHLSTTEVEAFITGAQAALNRQAG